MDAAVLWHNPCFPTICGPSSNPCFPPSHPSPRVAAPASRTGPLHPTDEDRLHDDPDSAYDWELDNDPDDLAALNQATWQFPTFQYSRR